MPQKIAITGSSGLIGGALSESLLRDGHTVIPVVRSRPGTGEIGWSPTEGEIEAEKLEGVDAVVHLAGEPIDSRWTADKKRRIRRSRVEGTALLARTLAERERPPAVLITASGVGYYGSSGDERLDESSPPGDDFLGRLGREWEAAADPAAQAGIRVAHSRTGVVLSSRGGVLAKIAPIFRLGLGGIIGTGNQWMSWISLPDVVDALRFILNTDSMSGAINVVAPAPVTNEEFTRELGHALHRPTILWVPSPALRLTFGEMADATILASQRAYPDRLLSAGFQFRYPDLRSALGAVL